MAMGGVGEAMLLGAAMGGGSAALTGGDPLKGALMGGLTGGIGGAISPALSAMTGGVPAAAIAPVAEAGVAASAAPVVTQAGTQAATQAGTNLATSAAASPYALTSPSIAPVVNTGVGGGGGITSLSNNLSPSISPSATTPSLSGLRLPGTTPDLALGAPSPAGPQTFTEGMQKFMKNPLQSIKDNPMTAFSSAIKGATGARKKLEEPEEYDGPLKRFKFNPESYRPAFYGAEGGIASLAGGGYDRQVGEDPMYMSNMASGGIANLGSYSDGGRMLRGPGDGMSDSIPASISGKRPARLADGEFVVPADVVSHLGNGSTDAGAKQLYAMMNKVRQARTGRKSQGREIDPRKYTPAYA